MNYLHIVLLLMDGILCAGDYSLQQTAISCDASDANIPPTASPSTLFGLHILHMTAHCNIVNVMNENSHEQWLLELIGSDSMRTAAQKSKYAQTTISRQLSRGYLRPEMVIALCRAYDHSPVAGLIEIGYINDYEIHGPDVEIALHEATNEQLLDEIMRRSDPQARYLFGNDGDDNAIGLAPHLTPVSDAHGSLHDDDDGIVREFNYSPDEYAADSSPNEQEEREKRGEDLID